VSRAEPANAELERIFRAAVGAAHPRRAVAEAVQRRAGRLEIDGEPLPEGSPLAVLAVGKAASSMADAFAERAGERIARGLAVGLPGSPPVQGFRMLAGAHPVPDTSSARAGRAALEFAAGVGPDEVLVVLLSGGSSSLLACPAAGLSLEALAETTRLLLSAGAPIDELNCVRKHLSAVSGGRLAAATRAGRVLALVVSDVPGDRLDVIGSGPLAPDPSRYDDARRVLRGRGVWEVAPPEVRAHLDAGAAGSVPETPADADPRVRHVVIASNRTALAGAGDAARTEGLVPLLLSDQLAGEARVAGRRLGQLARSLRPERALCLLAGGETTVRVTGRGRGGRSQELALSAALALAGAEGVCLLAAGTDGCDGPTDAAGAFADGGSVARAATRGVEGAARLEDNDAYRFFAAIDGLLRTGPTGTNVMDLVLIRCEAGRRA
jgi:glycerate-2-kinase